MTRTVFDNDSVAHVWAQNAQAEGRSHNGQFFFDGPSLYSYGRHYLAGFILPSGRAFINADSNSMTTNRHVSRARSAVSHRSPVMVPNLTGLRDALRWAAWAGGDTRIDAPSWWQNAPGTVGNQSGAEASERFKAEAIRWAVDTFGASCRYGSLVKGAPLDSLAPVLEAFGLGRKVAQVTRDIMARTRKAEAEARKAQEHKAQTFATFWAEKAPQDLEAEARDALARTYGEPLDVLEGWSRDLFRAIRWAKARKSWARKAEKLKARRAQVRALIAWEKARRERRTARALAVDGLQSIRDGLAAFGGDFTLSGHALGVARTLGAAWGSDGSPLGDGAEAKAQDARERGGAVALAGVIRVLEGAPLGHRTRARLEALGATLRPIVKAAQAERAARLEARAQAKEAARLEAERDARESWLKGDGGRWYGRDAQGGAYLRAVDVTRDDSGNVTGGTLETSQGANVPLAHALRVFRFLKWCRDTGSPWHRNGRTIRVGFYQVDSVDADGSFRAGCHRINWPQVAALAERLGVADLAPDSTVATPSGAAA